MAATSLGEIVLDLVVNQNQFQRQMTGITGLAKKAGATLATAFATKQIVQFSKECLNLGSDLQEVQNVVDVTFPKMSAQVDNFADSAAASFGLSETMAKRFTGTFGSMAKAFGFTEQQAYDMGTTLTRLAGDVASFYNISQDEAYTKLKSVFTGETESLKDLGVVMTQTALDSYALANGFGKTTQQMSEAEKVALRYRFVQEQLSAASGDFARTSDGWANQVRVLNLQFDSLKATIGQGLINLFTPVIKVINDLIGRLSVLADSFKAFTELITGQKSSGVGNIASDAAAASAGLGSAADSAGNLAENTENAGAAAQKTMKTLMGFDKINKLSEQSASGNSGASTGISGSTVDYGSLAQGETVMDSLGGKMQGLLDGAKELAGLLKKGFTIGFGDSNKRIKDLQGNIKNIGKSLKDIFTDKNVTNSAEKMFESFALSAGKIAGSYTSTGITIATALTGGISKYLNESSPYIKEKLSSIFDVRGEMAGISADFAVAVADIFTVFSGENATSIISSIIGIFSDAFLGVTELSAKFSRDILSTITTPFVENKESIRETIDNTLGPISEILNTLHQSVKNAFEKIAQVYDEHVSPMFKSFEEGFGEILGTLLDGYNKHIAPVLDAMSKRFTGTWNEHVQPVIDQAIELFGKLADGVKDIWEQTLQPFLNWIASNIMPIVAPILETLGNAFLGLVQTVSGVVSGILEALEGIIDFVTGVFTGDLKLAFKGVFETLEGVLKVPFNGIIGMLNGLVQAMATAVNSVANMLNSLTIDIPDWVPVIGGGSWSPHLPTWTPPQIPYLAQGGFVEKNTPRLAMIGDNRHYGEIVAPEDKMQAMADAAARGVKSGITRDELESIVNSATLRIIAALSQLGFYLDGEEMARAMNAAQESLNWRYNNVTVK